jgi:hypothetical protein
MNKQPEESKSVASTEANRTGEATTLSTVRRPRENLGPGSPSISQLVSYRKPDGLILSTGNLYFTYHDAATASVWRAAQSAVPGQEILLYSEPARASGTSSSHTSTAHSGDTSSRITGCDRHHQARPVDGRSGHRPRRRYRRRRGKQPS